MARAKSGARHGRAKHPRGTRPFLEVPCITAQQGNVARFLSPSPESSPDPARARPRAAASYGTPSLQNKERYLRGVATFLLWARCVEILSLNLFTGPLLSMVFTMIRRDIGRYVVLQARRAPDL